MRRNKIANELNLIDENVFSFCWVVDYPMFEIDENTKKIEFSHNPFSMPQGDIDNLDRALKADSSSSAVGSLLGCSPVTSYVESSAGIEAGGRTGLTAVTVGILFLLAIFLLH